jgi:hypothetical protein
MNAIELMMALFLNAAITCHALPADVQRIDGQDYQILSFGAANASSKSGCATASRKLLDAAVSLEGS